MSLLATGEWHVLAGLHTCLLAGLLPYGLAGWLAFCFTLSEQAEARWFISLPGTILHTQHSLKTLDPVGVLYSFFLLIPLITLYSYFLNLQVHHGLRQLC